MKIVLSESKSIAELRKVYNDKVTFVTTVKTYPIVHEIEFPGDYYGAMRKRRVPARVGRKLDKEIEAYKTQLTKIWDTYQKRIQRVTSFKDVKLIRRLLANGASIKKAGLTLARVLRETNPTRRRLLQMRFLRQEKQRLVKSQIDEMRRQMERVSRPAFERVYKIGKIRSQILSDQELDDDLTDQDRKVLKEREKWNNDFLNNLSNDSWAHYEAVFNRRFDDPNDIIDALMGAQKEEEKERRRLPLFAAAVGSVLLAAGIARAAKDIFTDPKTGKEQDEPILDDLGIPIGDPIKGGTWHTRHDNRVCPGCEKNDGKWMTVDEFDGEAGTNQCLTRCRCIELFELKEKPVRRSEIWRGRPGEDIGKSLTKHQMGQHDQDRHGRRGGASPAPTNFSNPSASRAAQAYVKQAGLPDVTSHTPVKVDKARARRIAEAYDQMKHEPKSLEVRAAYKAMSDEVLEQYKTLPVKIEYTKGDPYSDSKSMMRDVLKNKRLRIFTGGEPHPLLGGKGLDGVTINDNFRAVHDYYGHVMRGFRFGPSGEENAWMEHSKMFSPTAQLAMTTETRGQNSWFNFSKENEGKEPKDREFARQKVGILPDEFLPKTARRRKVQVQ